MIKQLLNSIIAKYRDLLVFYLYKEQAINNNHCCFTENKAQNMFING